MGGEPRHLPEHLLLHMELEMKMHRLILTALSAVVFIALIVSGYWFYHHNLNFACSSSTSSFSSNINSKVSFDFSQHLTFDHWGKAVIHISGGFKDQNGEYVLNRTAIYNYKRIGAYDYSMRVINVTRAGSDTVPSQLERLYLMPIVQGTHRILGIQQLPSGGMVISNNAGPYMMCAVH